MKLSPALMITSLPSSLSVVTFQDGERTKTVKYEVPACRRWLIEVDGGHDTCMSGRELASAGPFPISTDQWLLYVIPICPIHITLVLNLNTRLHLVIKRKDAGKNCTGWPHSVCTSIITLPLQMSFQMFVHCLYLDLSTPLFSRELKFR